jgi:hypothetical protein
MSCPSLFSDKRQKPALGIFQSSVFGSRLGELYEHEVARVENAWTWGV